MKITDEIDWSKVIHCVMFIEVQDYIQVPQTMTPKTEFFYTTLDAVARIQELKEDVNATRVMLLNVVKIFPDKFTDVKQSSFSNV